MKVTTCEKNEKETNNKQNKKQTKKETKKKVSLTELSVKKKILYLLLPLVGNTKIL